MLLLTTILLALSSVTLAQQFRFQNPTQPCYGVPPTGPNDITLPVILNQNNPVVFADGRPLPGGCFSPKVQWQFDPYPWPHQTVIDRLGYRRPLFRVFTITNTNQIRFGSVSLPDSWVYPTDDGTYVQLFVQPTNVVMTINCQGFVGELVFSVSRACSAQGLVVGTQDPIVVWTQWPGSGGTTLPPGMQQVAVTMGTTVTTLPIATTTTTPLAMTTTTTAVSATITNGNTNAANGLDTRTTVVNTNTMTQDSSVMVSSSQQTNNAATVVTMETETAVTMNTVTKDAQTPLVTETSTQTSVAVATTSGVLETASADDMPTVTANGVLTSGLEGGG
eukprot:Colp12_sorted_trinity150504_noHs@9578